MAKPAGICANCRHYRAPKAPPDGVDASRDIGGVFSHGECRRYPAHVKRRPADDCGEYSKG